LLWGN